MGPMVDEAAVTAAEKSASYPSSTMALISIGPHPGAVGDRGSAHPGKDDAGHDIGMAQGPGNMPDQCMGETKKPSWRYLPYSSSWPASAKNGMARNGKFSKRLIMTWGITLNGMSFVRMKPTQEIPMAKAMGTRKSIRRKNTIIRVYPLTWGVPLSGFNSRYRW